MDHEPFAVCNSHGLGQTSQLARFADFSLKELTSNATDTGPILYFVMDFEQEPTFFKDISPIMRCGKARNFFALEFHKSLDLLTVDKKDAFREHSPVDPGRFYLVCSEDIFPRLLRNLFSGEPSRKDMFC